MLSGSNLYSLRQFEKNKNRIGGFQGFIWMYAVDYYSGYCEK